MVRIKLKRRKKVAAKPKRQQRMELPKVDPLIDKLSRLIDQIGFSAFENYKPSKEKITARNKKGKKIVRYEGSDWLTAALEQRGINPKKVTPQALAEANRFLHLSSDERRKAIARMNGRLNNKRLTIDPATGDAIEFAPASLQATNGKNVAPNKRVRLKRRQRGKSSDNSSDQPQEKPRKKKEGPSNKEIIYRAWEKLKDKRKANPKKLQQLVDGEIKIITIAGWLSAWPKGKKLPGCAGGDPHSKGRNVVRIKRGPKKAKPERVQVRRRTKK